MVPAMALNGQFETFWVPWEGHARCWTVFWPSCTASGDWAGTVAICGGGEWVPASCAAPPLAPWDKAVPTPKKVPASSEISTPPPPLPSYLKQALGLCVLW